MASSRRAGLLFTVCLCLAPACADQGETAVLFPNGDLEQDGEGWTIPESTLAAVSAEQAASGKQSLKITDDDANGGSNVTGPKITLAGPGLYFLRGKVYPVSGTGLGVYVRLYGPDGQALRGRETNLTLGGTSRTWESFEQTIMADERVAAIEVWVHSYNASVVTAYLDDFELVQRRLATEGIAQSMTTIKERLRQDALAGRADADAAKGYAAALKPDGTWPDIDYADRTNGAWKPAGHVSRLLTMTTAYAKPDSSLAGDAALLQSLLRAYDWWTVNRPQCPNWWFNQIGVPRVLYRAMLLVEGRLSPDQLAAGIEVLAAGQLGMTGQNLVWVAEVTIARGCLAGKPWEVAAAFDRMAREVRISDGEGIKADGSFFQHGDQLYSGGYGRGFSIDAPYFFALARGTTFAFAPEQVDTLSMYLLDGQQWMTYGPMFDYSACGREICRRGAATSRGLVSAVEHVLELDPPRRAEFAAFAKRLTEDPLQATDPLLGNKHFWCADFMTHHRNGWYASVRLTSTRTLQTELVNQENQLGRHLSDGVDYVVRRGDEYAGIFPVWDWQRLPGTTCELTGDMSVKNGQRGKRSFAGGVSDGRYGLAAMDFERDALTARKAWLFCDEGYLAMGAGINCDTDNDVVTTLNQCLQNGDVAYAAGGKVSQTTDGEQRLERLSWVQQDGIGYVVLDAGAATVRCGQQEGSWRRLIPYVSDQPVSLDVFSLWLDHGQHVADGHYAYLVTPGMSADEVAGYAAAPPVQVVANKAGLQAAWHAGTKLAGAAFYEPGEVKLPNGVTLAVDQPCLLLYREADGGVTLSVSNPEHKPGKVTVTVNGKPVAVELPSGREAGSSALVELSARG